MQNNIGHESCLIQMVIHVSHLIPKPLSLARKNCLERGRAGANWGRVKLHFMQPKRGGSPKI